MDNAVDSGTSWVLNGAKGLLFISKGLKGIIPGDIPLIIRGMDMNIWI